MSPRANQPSPAITSRASSRQTPSPLRCSTSTSATSAPHTAQAFQAPSLMGRKNPYPRGRRSGMPAESCAHTPPQRGTRPLLVSATLSFAATARSDVSRWTVLNLISVIPIGSLYLAAMYVRPGHDGNGNGRNPTSGGWGSDGLGGVTWYSFRSGDC